MSTLNIAIAQDVESSKDSEVVISNANFDSSETFVLKYREESKQIADILTKFSESIPEEDFKADILLTKYQNNLESLKDELSIVLGSVSKNVYDELTREFKVNLSNLDKSELTEIVLSDYKKIVDESESKIKPKDNISPDESEGEFRTVEVETDSDFNNLEAAETTKSDSAYQTFKPLTSETDETSDRFESSDSKPDSTSDSFNKTDSSKDLSSNEFKTAKEVLDENVLSFDTVDFKFDYSESENSIRNPSLNEQIQMGWDKLLDETKDNLPFKGVTKRFQENTANPEAWTRVANDMAMSVTSTVFNAGIKIASSVDGRLMKAITDLPGYMSSVINESLINPTNNFIKEVSSTISDTIHEIVDLPMVILDTVIDRFKNSYASFLGGISGFVKGIKDAVSNGIQKLIYNLLNPDKVVMIFKDYKLSYEGFETSFNSVKKLDYNYEKPEIKTQDYTYDYEYGISEEKNKDNKFAEKLYKSDYKAYPSNSSFTLPDSKYDYSYDNSKDKNSPVTFEFSENKSDSALKRSYFRTKDVEFLSDAFWDIKITPHEFKPGLKISPPNLLSYYGLTRLPIISFDLSGEMIDNSDFELYNSFMTSYPAMYSRMNRLTISLPEMVRTVDGKLTSSLRKFKEDYILYVTGGKLSPSFRDFRYCAYEIEVTKFTQYWSLIKTWKLLGIPEFNNSTRGGSDSSIEIGEISFNIVGEDLKSSEEAKQNEKSAYDTLLDERNARNSRED